MKIIRSHENQNQPIVDFHDETLPRTYFNLIKLQPGEAHAFTTESYEMVCVVLSGQVDIRVGDMTFASVGQRESIWSGHADSVYAPPGHKVEMSATELPVEIVVAGALAESWEGTPFRITPEEVECVDVGSSETKSKRSIRHILGQKHNERVAWLLVSELYAEEGCWSGYPPHKHDTDREGEETAHEELYHFRFQPETGFGAQFCYESADAPGCVMTRHGDTCLIDKGYHPTVTSPGHNEYLLAVLVGKSRRGLIQHFEAQHTHMMDRYPGIANMRKKFK